MSISDRYRYAYIAGLKGVGLIDESTTAVKEASYLTVIEILPNTLSNIADTIVIAVINAF
jgi:hypothetical protein